MSASPKDDPLHRGGDDDYDYEDDVVPFDAPVDELADTAASLDLTSVKMFLESVSHNATLPPARTDDFNATMQSEREMPSHPLEALVVGEGSPNPVRDHSHLRPAAAVGRSRSHTKEQPTNSTPSHEPSPGFTAEGDWDVVPFDLDAAAAQADETVTGTNLGDGFLQGLFAKRASVALHNGILHGSHRPSFLEVDNENTLVKQPSVLQGAGSFARFFRRFSSTQHESTRRGSSSRASDVRTSSRAASSAADDDEDRDKEDEEGGEDYQDLMIQARLNGIIMGEWRSRLAISGPADLLLEYMCDAAATVERQQIEERRVLETSMRSTLTRSSGYQLHQVEIAESSARLRQWQQQSRDWVAVLCEPWRRELLEGAGVKGFALIARLALTESEDIARKRIVKSHTKAVHHFVKVREFLLELRTSSINQLSQLHVEEGAGRQAIVSQRQLQNSTYALLNAAYRQHIAIRAAEESERVLLLLNTLVLKEAMRRSAIKKQRAEGLADLQDEERTSWRSTVTRLGERQLHAALLQLEDVSEPQARGVLESDQQAARIKLLKLYKTKKPKPLRLDVLLERSETQARAAIAVESDEALRDIAQDYHLYTPYLLQLETARQALTTTDEPQSRAAIAKSDKEERRYLFTLFQLEDRQQARREKIAASATNEFTTRIVAWRDQALWLDSQPPTVKMRIREMATGMEKNEATQRKYIVNTEAAARDAIVVPFMEVHRSNFTTPQRRKSTLQRRSSTTPGQSNVTTPSALVSGPSPPPGSPTRPLTRQTPSTLRSKWERVLKDLDAVDEQPFEQSDDNVAPALTELLHQRDDARRVSRDARRQSGASARASSFTIGRPSDRRASAVVESAIGPSPGSVHRPQPPMGQSPGVSPRIIAKPDASPKLASRTGSFSLASTQRPSVRNTGLPPQSPKTSAPNPSAFRRDSTSIRA